MVVQQPPPQRVDLARHLFRAGGDWNCSQGTDHGVGSGRFDPDEFAQQVPGRQGQAPVVIHGPGQASRIQRAQKSDGGGDGEVRGGIVRAHVVEEQVKAGAIGAGVVPAVADHRWNEAVAQTGPGPEKGRAFGRTQPLVAITRVVGSPQAVEVERHHPRAMGAVDHHCHAPGLEGRHDVLDREYQSGR